MKFIPLKKRLAKYHFYGLDVFARDTGTLAIVLDTMEQINEQTERYERTQILILLN